MRDTVTTFNDINTRFIKVSSKVWYFCIPQSHQICYTFEQQQINFQYNYNVQNVQITCALSHYTEAQCHISGVLNDITYNTTFSNDVFNIYINVSHSERFLTDCRKTRTKVITVTNQKDTENPLKQY